MSSIRDVYPARKASWNPAGVEHIHKKTSGYQPRLTQMGENQNVHEFGAEGTHQTGVYGVWGGYD